MRIRPPALRASPTLIESVFTWRSSISFSLMNYRSGSSVQ
jgi:hypothetical protein